MIQASELVVNTDYSILLAGDNRIATVAGLTAGDAISLRNTIDLLVAALLIAGLANIRAAKTVNTVIGAAYLLLGVAGFFLVGTAANILALNVPDHFLHLASAIVLLGVGLGAERTARTATA